MERPDFVTRTPRLPPLEAKGEKPLFFFAVVAMLNIVDSFNLVSSFLFFYPLTVCPYKRLTPISKNSEHRLAPAAVHGGVVRRGAD